MIEEVQKMTDSELVNELNSSEEGLEFGVSRKDLIYNETLWQEINLRELNVQKQFKLII